MDKDNKLEGDVINMYFNDHLKLLKISYTENGNLIEKETNELPKREFVEQFDYINVVI